MNIRVGRGISQAHADSIEKAGDAWLLPLIALALELPMKVARIVGAVLHTGSSVRDRNGIGVPPMSADWLHDLAADSGKHDDRL